MTIKDYIISNDFNILNKNHEGINYEFKNIRKSDHTYSNAYIIFDEKFLLKKMCDNIYKLIEFCRLEELSEQIDKIAKVFYNDLFEIEMLDKNNKSYIVQFIRNKYSMNEKSTLRIYEGNSGNYIISNPYGPAFASFKEYELVQTRFYLLGKELTEFEIEVLKATKA